MTEGVMAKRAVAARLDEGLWQWAEAYADERGVSKTAVLEAALKALREDAAGGVPELPEPEPAPGPVQTGTDHWRDPTDEEVADARERYPDLPPERLRRLARAEARQRDMGVLAPVDATREDVAGASMARVEAFARLWTPESVKSPKPKGGRS